MEPNKYIGKRGYVIRKKSINENIINEVRSELTVKPFVNSDYGATEEPFKIYLENNNKLYVPKFYGIEKFGNPDINLIQPGLDINIDFSLNLKEEQKIPAQHTINAYYEKGGGILSLPCGFGKTILALYFISVLKKKTLVIVHKEFLMNQWIERIKFALPTANVGIIQGDKCEIEGSDIIIGMLQTLSMKDFPTDAFDSIGHVIIDECHRIPSKVFSRALLKINSIYMLGLSATPNRKDGLTKVLKYYIGDIIYSVKSNEKNIVKVDRYLLNSTDENYNKEIVNFRGQVQMPSMLNNISTYYKRTKLIMEKVIEEINNNDIRQILILSDRKQQLEDMYKLSIDSGINSVGYYIGGMKKEKLKENESCKILLGTFPMANEGLDIPSLNGLVLATPKSDIIQSIGRICRVKHENIQPLIIDIVDKFSIFENQSMKRFNVYKKKKYQITDISYNLDKNCITFNKNHMFHISSKESESEDEEEEKDKISNKKQDNKQDNKKNNSQSFEKIFNSFSLFTDFS